MVGAEEGASDRDRCSAVRAQAANTLMNLSSCCQPCIKFSPRFFHYKNVSVTVIVLLLFLLLLVVVAVAFVVRFCFSFASHLLRQRALSAQILCCSAYLPLTLSLSFCLTLTLTPCLVLSACACPCLPLSPSFVCQFSAFGYNFLGPFVMSAVICLGLFLFLSLLHTSFIFRLFFDFPSQFFFAATAEQTYSLFSLLVLSSKSHCTAYTIHTASTQSPSQ